MNVMKDGKKLAVDLRFENGILLIIQLPPNNVGAGEPLGKYEGKSREEAMEQAEKDGFVFRAS